MDSVVAHVGLVHSADHVEMDGVRSEDKGLANHGQLNRVDTALSGLIAR